MNKTVRLLRQLIQQGGNLSIRVVKTTRWQRQKGDELLDLVIGKKTIEEKTYFPPPPSEAQEVARWDVGKYDVHKWG